MRKLKGSAKRTAARPCCGCGHDPHPKSPCSERVSSDPCGTEPCGCTIGVSYPPARTRTEIEQEIKRLEWKAEQQRGMFPVFAEVTLARVEALRWALGLSKSSETPS